MPRLAITLLGTLQAELDGEPVTRFPTDRERALLAYLAVESHRAHSRESLAAFLWPNQPEDIALGNLRKSLHRLRQTIGPDDFLIISPNALQFNLASDHSLDTAEFESAIEKANKHRHRNSATCQTCLACLARAARQYQGDFLQGVSLPDSLAFDEWLSATREQLRLQALDALHQLAERLQANGHSDQARQYALRQLELDPWRESAHRQLMWALAQKGERTAALAQYEACRRVLRDELDLEPEAATVALYEKIKTGHIHSPAAPPRQNLRAPPTPFFGRETELALLRDRLLDPGTRLLTLMGEGGIGKTRLALHAATEVAADFADGAWVVPLAGLAQEGASEAVARAIAAALGMTFFGNTSSQVQLLSFLRAKECLLILDNFEHLLDGADLIQDILDKAPRVVVVITTREPLQLQIEQTIHLEGLPVPTAAHIPGAEGFSSLLLFAERAERARDTFSLTPANTPLVIEICRLLEGLPLGIELAAAQTQYRAPEAILKAIRENFNSLAVTMRDLPARHRSLRAVFEGTWQLLTVEAQLVLAKASIFRGGFTVEAGQAVAGATLPVLAALVGKSLVHPAAPGRYDLHELLRQFAAEKLTEIENAKTSVAASHQAFYLRFVGQRGPALNGLTPAESIREVQTELDNVSVAWSEAVRQMNLSELEQAEWGLATFYNRTSLHQAGERAFQEAIERLESEIDTQTDDALLSRLVANEALFLYEQGRVDESVLAAKKATHLGQQAKDSSGETAGHLRWGQALWGQGKYTEAREQLEQAVNLAHTPQLSYLKADALRTLGATSLRLGDYAEARAYYEKSAQLCRETGDRLREAGASLNLGMICYELHLFPEAQIIMTQALEWGQNVSSLRIQTIALNTLGLVANQQGEFDRAQVLMEESLRLSRQSANPLTEGTALTNLGDVALHIGDYAGAKINYELALALFREISNRQGESHVLAYLALMFHLLGENVTGHEHGQQALAISQAIGARREQALALTFIGHTLHELGQATQAVGIYEQARELWEMMKAHNRALEALAGLARVALAQGNLPQASDQVEVILSHLETSNLEGSDDPFRVYLTCYQVLIAVHDPRAQTLIRNANAQLLVRAGKIKSATLRHSFLENVPSHREIQHLNAGALPS